MESNGGLEGVIGGQQRLVEQAGNLIEQAIQLERVRLEAEQAKRNVQEVRASQLTSAVAPQTPQAPLSGGYTGIRDMWRPLEALVQQGHTSVGGVEPFRTLVFERISDAVRQVYKDSGYNDPGSIVWSPRENGGWSNDLIYICNSCSTVQRKDTKEKLTSSPAEYQLIFNAFKLLGLLLHGDTASCSGEEESARSAYPQDGVGITPAVQTAPPGSDTLQYGVTNRGIIERERAELREELKKSIGGDWYPVRYGGWWNSLYLFCQTSQKAYSRTTGEEFKSSDVGKVFKIIDLSTFENLCPATPKYPDLMKGYNSRGYNLPEAATLHAPINCQSHK